MWPMIYASVFAQAFALALVLTPLAGRLGRRLGMIDAPGERKIHDQAKPRSGGLAIYAAFVGALLMDLALLAWLVRPDAQGGGLAPYRANLALVAPRLAAILAGLTLLFAVGVADDRRPLGPWVKLLAQVLSAAPLLAAGARIDCFLHSALPPAIAGALGAALTVGWIVVLSNSLNFMDNMDGLTAGVSAVIALALAGFAIAQGDALQACACLALAGAVAGFLRHNWSPARLFMGDGGSLTIGFALAALTINGRYYEPGVPTGLPVLIPLIVMGVPLFDTVSVLWIRWRRGAPLMRGDTNHLSHRLVALGFSRPQAVGFICLLTLVIALMALPLRYLPRPAALLHTLGIAALFALLYVLERVARARVAPDAPPRP